MNIKLPTAAAVAFLATAIYSLAQTPLPHSFVCITALPDRTESLTIDTNTITASSITFTDPDAAKFPSRFYRAVSQ